MNKIIEVFRAGKQTDSSGKERVWTQADLDKMVKKYNEGGSGHEAPIVIGHPKTDAPAFGWVKKLSRKGDVLFAELQDVVEEFKEAFNKGLYKKRSISLYPDLTLKHVGFLGAQAPAIKGLADFKFSQAEEESQDFEFGSFEEETEFADFETSWGFRDVGRVFRNLREYLIGKGEKEAADSIVPNYTIKNLEDFKETDSKKTSLNSNFEETTQKQGLQKMKELEEAKAKIEKLESQAANFNEEKKTLELKLEAETKRADDAEKSLQSFQEKQEQEEISSFCESLVKQGKLAAGDKELTETTLLALKSSEKKFEFGEGEDKKEVSAFETMKAKLQNVKSKIEFGEFAKKGEAHEEDIQPNQEFSEVDQERQALHNKAKKIEKEQGISYSEALEKAQTL